MSAEIMGETWCFLMVLIISIVTLGFTGFLQCVGLYLPYTSWTFQRGEGACQGLPADQEP